MTEVELKFCVDERVLASLRDALLERGARRTRMRAHYFDTADGALARHRVALRMRLEGRRWIQTLKAIGDGAIHRLEHEVHVPGPVGRCPVLDPQRHDGSAAALRLTAALQTAADATLGEKYATDIWRLHCQLQCPGGTQVEAALDVGRVLAGGRTTSITELELEHKAGPVQGLFDLAAACVRHGGLWQSTVTKSEHGQRLLAAQGPRAVKATPPRLPAKAGGPVLMRALLQSALEQVLANASELAVTADDADVVHQFRVGLRRLRVLLHDLAPLAPAIGPAWAATLAETFAMVGGRREQDALAATIRPLLLAAAAPATEWHAPATADVGAVVREPSFQAVLVEMQALAHAGDDGFAALSAREVRRDVAGRLRDLHRRVTRAGRHFEGLSTDEQHRVRKKLKRLRYLAEFTFALWPDQDISPYRRRLAQAQEALGLHHDVAIAAAIFRSEAAGHPEAWFAAGYLQAHLAVTARAARRALASLGTTAVFWR